MGGKMGESNLRANDNEIAVGCVIDEFVWK